MPSFHNSDKTGQIFTQLNFLSFCVVWCAFGSRLALQVDYGQYERDLSVPSTPAEL
jgi:hypothetical protein